MRISVDEDRCCGSGQCSMLVPEVFDQREDDGIVALLDASPPTQLHDSVREAADMCPTSAIQVEDAED
ncbi:ferredoxin [Saccharomonospora piscinae]|uniref:ferredoxin n=1 Tax=Saccharomonospora piscinae TaxID=687388 RepID=UPI00046359CD|nr:ferredoxin [Saccharomonospora piscinae]